MTDPQLFFASLALLYIVECLYWLPANVVIFRANWLGRCNAGFPTFVFSNSLRALVLTNPIPPFGSLFYAPPEPVTADTNGPDLTSNSRTVRLIFLRYRSVTGALRAVCGVHFLLLFAALPTVWILWGHRFIFEWFAAFCSSTLLVLILSHRAIRKLFPDRPSWPTLLRLLIYPPAAIHASVSIPVQAFAEFHPLPVAQVLCPPGAFAELTGRFLRDHLYPVPTSPVVGEQTKSGADPSFRKLQQDRLVLFIRKANLDLKSLLSPPISLADPTQPYCPRCFAQYAPAAIECSDCPGVKLRRYGSDSSSLHFGS